MNKGPYLAFMRFISLVYTNIRGMYVLGVNIVYATFGQLRWWAIKSHKLMVVGFFLLAFLISSNNINGQETITEPYTDKELKEVRNQYKNNTARANHAANEIVVSNLIQHFKYGSVWDSVYRYNEILSEVAHENGNLSLEMKSYLERLSQSRMFKNYDKKEYSRMTEFVASHLDTNRLNYDILNQAYINHSSHLFGEGLLDSALYYNEKAIRLADKSKDPVLRILNRLTYGLKLESVKKYELKLNVLLKAEKIAKTAASNPIYNFRIYKDIGLLLYEINDLGKAEYYIDKAISVADAAGYTLFMADAEVVKGKIRRQEGNILEAHLYLNKAVKKFRKAKYNARLADAFSEIAQVYLDDNNIQLTELYIDSCLLVSGSSNNKVDFLKANYNLKAGNYSEVDEFLNLYKNENRYNDRYNDIYYKISYKYYKARGRTKEALTNFEKFVGARDSINSKYRNLKIHRIESEYNRDKQDLEISNLNALTVAQDKALAVRNTALWMGGSMLCILGGLLFGLYRLYQKNQDHQKELAVQNKQITEALSQNQILIKEIHHRVKNNLQVVSSLLSMQARKLDDGETKDALNSSKTRVQSMSILHQNLYQGDEITEVKIDDYLQKLVENIVDTYRVDDNIEVTVDIDHVSLDVDTLVPLGLIANELICNALKYAFEGMENGKLKVSFREIENTFVLRVADNGVGFEGDSLPIKKGSLGTRLIHSFTEKLEGKMKIDMTNGTDISITFEKEKLHLG